jgi:hypothetical protein
MSLERQPFYPGEGTSAHELVALAGEYHAAADALASIGRRGVSISRAPYRLVAIHAIELYLNAYLISVGYSATDVRRLQHDVSLRIAFAETGRLGLRLRTRTHLASLSERREYLTTRYDPAPPALSELNRLAATLNEVGQKVSALLNNNGAKNAACDRIAPMAGTAKRAGSA